MALTSPFTLDYRRSSMETVADSRKAGIQGLGQGSCDSTNQAGCHCRLALLLPNMQPEQPAAPEVGGVHKYRAGLPGKG